MSGAGLTQRKRGAGPTLETPETRLEYDDDYVRAAAAAASSPVDEGISDPAGSRGDLKGTHLRTYY
jgi:hypothetical protein